MEAKTVFEELLSCIKNSGLNFVLTETPFSVNIVIKKTFFKTKEEEKSKVRSNTTLLANNNLKQTPSKFLTSQRSPSKDTFLHQNLPFHFNNETLVAGLKYVDKVNE